MGRYFHKIYKEFDKGEKEIKNANNLYKTTLHYAHPKLKTGRY